MRGGRVEDGGDGRVVTGAEVAAEDDEAFVGVDLAADGGCVQKCGELGGGEGEVSGEEIEGEMEREDRADEAVCLERCGDRNRRQGGHAGSVRGGGRDASFSSFLTDNSLSVGEVKGEEMANSKWPDGKQREEASGGGRNESPLAT